jgi:hypothetical protein
MSFRFYICWCKRFPILDITPVDFFQITDISDRLTGLEPIEGDMGTRIDTDMKRRILWIGNVSTPCMTGGRVAMMSLPIMSMRIIRVDRYPTNGVLMSCPRHPSWSIVMIRSPHPTVVMRIIPVSVMVREPSPRFQRNPGPSPKRIPNPSTETIWDPPHEYTWTPAVAIAGIIDPDSIIV